MSDEQGSIRDSAMLPSLTVKESVRLHFKENWQEGFVMSTWFRVLLPALTLVLTMAGQAHAQAPTLQEQLTAQYKVVKMGSDKSGYAGVDAGTPLGIKKGWSF